MKASVHSYESLAALDGEGLRFAVFLAGCPLRCWYCHNPDTWEMGEGSVTPEELVKKAARYKPYFATRGGVTFSGGEPLLHAQFLRETVPLLSKEGIGYAIDTSGAVPLSEDVRFVLENADSVILDLKFFDDEGYRKYTGFGMENTLKTLDFLEERKKRTLLRTVVVPNINDTEEAMEGYADVSRKYSCVYRHELLAFHRMGFFKYEKLGIPNPLESTPALSSEKLAQLQTVLDEKRKKNG